jgi:fatty acid desaturase
MANDKKVTKREQRLARKAKDEQATQDAVRKSARRRILLIAVPLATLVIALGLYQIPSARSTAGLTLLGGFLLWLAVALGTMGGGVSARDRGSAGAIDYGKRR